MLGLLFDELFRRGKKSNETARQRLSDASALFAERSFEAALAKVSLSLELDSKSVAALQLQGAILATMGNFPAAQASFRAALRHAPKNAGLRLDFGNALRLAGDLECAEIEYLRALELEPDSLLTHKALGSLLLDLGRAKEAVALLQEARQLDATDESAQRLLGRAAFKNHDFLLVRDSLLPLYPGDRLTIDEQYSLGASLLNLGELQSAGEVLEAAHRAEPDNTAVIQSLSFKHLYCGNWREGFCLYEVRLENMRRHPEINGLKAWVDFVESALASIPVWKEGGVENRQLLVWAEQGYGDNIMMLRMLPVLLSVWRAESVSFLCPRPLMAMAPAFPGIRFIQVDLDWKPLPGKFDLHCSIMSLPFLMQIERDAIPGSIPYLFPPAERCAAWARRVAPLPGLRVGLVWAGSATLTLDALRSLALDQLRPLLSCPGVSFVSLQEDDTARDELRASGFPIADWMDQCADMMDTAALIQNLDLVISVDTFVAHLAGALGKPVWLLNRFESEWRWMRDREDSVWYPSMRLFTQPHSRNWQAVLERIARELNSLVASVSAR